MTVPDAERIVSDSILFGNVLVDRADDRISARLESGDDADGWRERHGGRTPPAAANRVALRNVTFAYPSATRPGVSDVTLDVAPGEVIALVGENGAGKSTLARVIAGLYRPQSGLVSYGGIPVDSLDLQRLRRHIAVVAQDFTRWPLSLQDNITVGEAADDAGTWRRSPPRPA